MNKCDKKSCQSNKDGICLGNWTECPVRKREEQVSSRMNLILLVILIILLLFFTGKVVRHDRAEEATQIETTQMVQERHVLEGQYTIFQYTQVGWTNRIYVTEYYEEAGYLYYKLKDYPEDYLFIKAEDFLPVPGWVESIDELMKYGFWEPMEFDWLEQSTATY